MTFQGARWQRRRASDQRGDRGASSGLSYHAKQYNIRVMNLSLASSSTQTWQKDPLCAARAQRDGSRHHGRRGGRAISACRRAGQEVYGAISSPGDDPSVITVGAVNYHNSLSRSVETVDHFSSRGPTRGSYVNASGVTQYDNLLKPDLVAPGNKVVSGAAMTQNAAPLHELELPWPTPTTSTWLLSAEHSRDLPADADDAVGTSVAAPSRGRLPPRCCCQANPGLTPPLIKAILQYTAQPLPGFNLLEQGRGPAERGRRRRTGQGAA